MIGTDGVEGKQANWTQFIGIPAISEFIGLPNNNVGAPFDLMLIRFNIPIDKSTLVPERVWMKDGTSIFKSMTITPMDTEGLLFQLSGLQGYMAKDGEYSLTVDLPNIKSLNGINGMLAQRVEWKIDQTAPLVSLITPSTDGGYDWQHRTAFTVKFNEAVKGIGVSSLELWKDGLRQPLSQLEFRKNTDSEYLFTQFRMLTYYEGTYKLKVKMQDIIDNAGNSGTSTYDYDWIVYRKPPKAVTDLRIAPDMGFSDTDAITATKILIAQMTVNEPNTRIQLYQTDQVNPILLADTANVSAGPLSLPINLIYPGNVKLQAHCIDIYTNTSITEISVFIDEAALVSTWKNVPVAPLITQPASLQLEFSDKLLDDTKLKDNLKFERNGQLLGTQNLSISKSGDKLYVVSGLDQAGNATGTYNLSLDLTKLNKYLSGKQGISTSKAQWTIQGINRAPYAFAGINQTVDENTLATLDGSGSTDPDRDGLTYSWTAPTGITLSSTTAEKPTFTVPEVPADQVFTFSLIVNDGKINSAVSEVTITVKDLTGLSTQSIQLTAGWNIFSANVIPANPDMLAIFQSLINAGKLKKVMDEAGNAMEDWGVFGGGWHNGIGNLTINKGYKVNLKEPAILDLQGIPASLPMDINLTAGWNIISFPNTVPQDAMKIFQPLIDAGKLKKVMDEAGFALENYGVFGGWTNNIGNLLPNKGYKVNVLANATLTIPANGSKQAVIHNELLASEHFMKVFSGNGTDHMNINLVDLAKGGFKIGDELGIFDGNLCVGAAQIGPDQLTIDQISIPASCNDGLEPECNGFMSGNRLIIRLFRNNQEYLLTPELLFNSKSIFIKDESMFARVNTELATSLIDLASTFSVNCYPNPFSNQLTIEIDIPINQNLDVKIYDVSGRLIRNLYHGDGINKKIMVWDGKSDQGMKMASGNYYLKVNNTVKKVILKH